MVTKRSVKNGFCTLSLHQCQHHHRHIVNSGNANADANVNIDAQCERTFTREIFKLQLKIRGQFTSSESERESDFSSSLPMFDVKGPLEYFNVILIDLLKRVFYNWK